jgi:hypothetical protein
MAKDVKIKLTDEQKAKIKKGTGQDLSEIRVSAVGGNPAAATKQASARAMARAQSFKAAGPQTAARAQSFKAAGPQTAAKAFGPRSSGTENTE